MTTIETALGEDGYAFPMAVRGTLQGALVVAARAEQYTPDERELLAHVAQQVSVALRARDSETLIRKIASGTVELGMARERARQLCSINL